MKITDYVKPIGWTRDTNLSGYLSGTYDVLAVWPNGPEKEVWSQVAIYTEEQLNMKYDDVLKYIDNLEKALQDRRESCMITMKVADTRSKQTVYVWSSEGPNHTMSEDFYVSLNGWSEFELGYHARTAYNQFEFRTEDHLKKFLEFMRPRNE
jgi:hypothetical protein